MTTPGSVKTDRLSDKDAKVKAKIKAALESPPLLSPSHIFRTNGTLAML